MTQENITTNIVVNSNFTSLIADLNKVSSSLMNLKEQLNVTNKTLAAQISAMNRTFSETLRSTGQFSTHFVSLSSDVDKFGKQLDSGQMKLGQFFRTFSQHTKTSGGLIRDLAKQQVQLQNAILQPLGRNAEGLMQYNVQIPRGLDMIKNKSALANQELKIMNKVVQEGANQLINWGKNTQWAGRQLTVGLTVPMAAFGKAAADAFKVADEQLVRLTKVYGGIAPTTQKELAAIRKDVSQTAAELAKAYGTGFTETISLAADIAATGKQGNELLGSLKETTRLAVLGEVDKQSAMKATLAIQTAFKQNTDELTKSINFLNAVENQTSTSLADLVEAIPKAGPVIQAMGGSVKDLALYLTAMREGGINASEGANALKSALASLINPTKVAKEMFTGFGIDLGGIVTSNAGNLTATILELQGALDKLNPLQKQQAIEQLFGKFQFARMNALFSNLGKQGSQTLQVLDLMKASSQDLANIAGRELSQVTESASGKYRRAVEGLKADLAQIGDQFLKINTVLINVVDGIIKFSNKLPKPLKDILGFLGLITAAAGPLIMLTGVLANFFGYVVKGIFHMKSLFKGGEGWKLLTPEILAANKAAGLVEQTFYSDAKAASILQQALSGLAASYQNVAEKAAMAAVPVGPAVSTTGGNTIMSNGRVANPNNPLIGPIDTRAAGHHNPRSMMTETEKVAQTIHSVTPTSIPLNQKIGAAPQIFATGDMPKIEGLTTSRGASVGIVAQEAAKWHTMMGVLSMQTKTEVATLKKEIAQTGTVSAEFMQTYSQLLPSMEAVTQNAARASALIVKQVQAGELNVQQGRAAIMAENAKLEALMAQATSQVAADLGRTANLTTVPLINQPIVSSTGKSNLKELFKKGRGSKAIIDKIAGALGVKTWGGGYATETTIPKRFATGNLVPGSGNTDTVPAMLTPGEFVVNKDATSKNMGLLMAINGGNGNGSRTGNFRTGGGYLEDNVDPLRPKTSGLSSQEVGSAFPGFKGKNNFYTVKGTAGLYIGDVTDPTLIEKYKNFLPEGKTYFTAKSLNGKMANGKIPSELLAAGIQASGSSNRGSTEQFLRALAGAGIISEKEFKGTSDKIYNTYIKNLQRNNLIGDSNNDYWGHANKVLQQELGDNPEVKHLWNQFSSNIGVHTGSRTATTGKSGGSSSHIAQTLLHSDGKTKIKVGALRGVGGALFAHARSPQPFMQRLLKAGLSLGKIRMRHEGGIIGMNSGGVVPGYVNGGRVKAIGSFAAPLAAQMLAPMAGRAIGSSIGGQSGANIGESIGSGVAMASWILPMVMQFKKVGAVAEEGAKKTGLFSKAMMGLRAAGMFLGPWGIAGTAAVAGLTAGLLAYKKHIDEVAKTNRLAFSGAVKPTEDFNSKITDIRKNIVATNQARQALMATKTSAGLPAIQMTVAELQKLQVEVKKAYPEIIKLLNQTPRQDLNKTVAGLKAQFIQAGDAASVADKKILALLSTSNKAGNAGTALYSGSVAGMTSIAGANRFSLNNLSRAQNVGGNKGFVGALKQTFTGLDAAATAQGNSPKAIAAQFEAITKSQAKNIKLTQDQLNELAKTEPQLASILNTTDSIGDAYAKWRIVLSGVGKDLNGISSIDLQRIATYTTGVASYFDSLSNVSTKTAQSGLFGGLAKQINSLNAASKVSGTIAADIQASIKDQIALKQKQIQLIKDEADARKQALQDQQTIEDTKLQIQKEQLNYQNALASGDMQTAAQSQIAIQRLVGQQQLNAATDAIDKTAQAKIDKLQAEIDKLQAKSDAAGTSGSKNSNATANAASKLQSLYDELNQLLKTVELQGGPTPGDVTQFTDLVQRLKAAGASSTFLKGINPSGSGQAYQGSTLVNNASTDLNSLSSKANAIVEKNTGQTVKELIVIQNILRGRKDIGTGAGTSSDPYIVQTNSKYLNSNFNKTAGIDTGAIIKSNKFVKGDYFQYDGKTFLVETGYDSRLRQPVASLKKAIGGKISGPGTGTSDSIPAMLSHGEYVVNAASASSFGYTNLDKINKMAAGGMATRYDIPRMALGGKVNMDNGGLASNSNSMYNINVNVNNSNADARDIAYAIRKEMQLRDAMNGRDRTK